MRPVRSLLVVATILAFGALAPVVSAASPTVFHLEKTCVDDFTCTIQESSFKAIPAGTDITYTYDSSMPTLAFPSIEVRNGTTTGVCDWDQPGPTVLAVCTFETGSGRLAQFRLVVDVTFDGTTWFWDGIYWFGGGH